MARVQGRKENVRRVNKKHQTAFSKPKLWPKELDAAFGPHILFEQDGLEVLRMFFLPTMFLYDCLGIAPGNRVEDVNLRDPRCDPEACAPPGGTQGSKDISAWG